VTEPSFLGPLVWRTRAEADEDRQRRTSRVETARMIDRAMALEPDAMAAFAADIVARHQPDDEPA